MLDVKKPNSNYGKQWKNEHVYSQELFPIEDKAQSYYDGSIDYIIQKQSGLILFKLFKINQWQSVVYKYIIKRTKEKHHNSGSVQAVFKSCEFGQWSKFFYRKGINVANVPYFQHAIIHMVKVVGFCPIAIRYRAYQTTEISYSFSPAGRFHKTIVSAIMLNDKNAYQEKCI